MNRLCLGISMGLIFSRSAGEVMDMVRASSGIYVNGLVLLSLS